MLRSNMEISWREFHQDNPEVELMLFRLAMGVRMRGYKTYGLPALWEVLRYNMAIEFPNRDYKFPNGYKAYYARLLMLKHPALEDFFRIREMFCNGEPDLSDLVAV